MISSAVAMGSMIVFSFWGQEESSSYLQLNKIKKPKINAITPPSPSFGFSVGEPIEKKYQKEEKTLGKKKPKVIQYSAPQVIERDKGRSLAPIASKIKAILRYPLDTRYPESMVEAILPRAFFFRGKKIMPQKTVLIGKMIYRGRGDRVQVNFYRGVKPDGREFKLSAVAMDADSGLLGLKGIVHGNAQKRIAKTIGLSAISNMAHVLTQKEALGRGHGTSIEYKSTVPNALIYATGKTAKKEAVRRMERIGEGGDYITVKAHTAFIVVLSESFRGE